MKNILTRIFFFVLLIGFSAIGNAALLSDGGHSDLIISGKTSNAAPLVFSLEQAELTKNGIVDITVMHQNKTIFSLNTSQLNVTLPDLKLSSGETYTVIVRLGNSTYQQEAIW